MPFYALRRRNLWGAICRGLQPIISRGAASSFCARLLDNHTRCRTLINCELQLARSVRASLAFGPREETQRESPELNERISLLLLNRTRQIELLWSELMKILSEGVIIGFEGESPRASAIPNCFLNIGRTRDVFNLHFSPFFL